LTGVEVADKITVDGRHHDTYTSGQGIVVLAAVLSERVSVFDNITFG
jgi:hypothetical protein